MRRILVVLALFATACGRETASPAVEAQNPAASADERTTNTAGPCVLGTKLDASGNVAASQATFAAKEPIWITLRPAKPQPDVEVRTEILDPAGEEVKSVFKIVGQEQIVTFPIRNLEAGRYRAVSAWGNDALCELGFEIR